jgi:hypothetical protein
MYETELEELEEVIGDGMKSTLETLRLLRQHDIRTRFPRMSAAFESELEDMMKDGNPYKPSGDGGLSYAEEEEEVKHEETNEDRVIKDIKMRAQAVHDLGKEGKRVGFTSAATLDLVNGMRAKYSLPPAKLAKKRVQ